MGFNGGHTEELGCEESCPNNQKAVVSRTKPNMVKSYVEATKVAKEKERAAAREILLRKRGWGSQLARIWRLKGSLGLAKMERGKVLMEFEIPAEAEQVSKMGSILLGRVDLRLEKWNPETGCLKEGERSNEAWVRVVGLPVSMWERDILRKIGDACGGFIAIDHQTEKMEDLQWARLLVKRNGGSPPSLVEVWIDGFCYEVTLWWEIRPVIKVPGDWKEREDRRDRCEGRGSVGRGQNSDPNRSEDGLGLLGQASSSRGPKAYTSTGPSSLGLVFYGNGNGKPKEKAGPLGPDGEGLLCYGAQSRPTEEPKRGHLQLLGEGRPVGAETWRRDRVGGISRTDSALLEEDARYVPSSSGMVTLDPSPPFFSSFGRTPRKESFDRFGTLVESIKGDCLCKEIGHSQQFAGKCWDLVEISNDSMEDDRKALCLARPISQEEGAWVDEGWEESDWARFSQFLGFSTEGLEKDILEFMVKIRKRRERIHSKAMLEKSKFERELRRLECSVNYEGGRRERVLCKEEGVKLWKSNENKAFELEYDRDTFWGELGAIRGIWDDPWCVGGDFNVTLNLGERSNQGRLTGAMRRFAQVTDELELLDIPLHGGGGGGFLSGGRNNQAWARLDRFLVTQDWLDCFSGVLQCRLPRPVSDHFPILLKGGGEVFGRVEVNKNLALQQVEFWDRVESGRSLTERESELKTEAKEAFKNWVLLEETHWRQSSRSCG
ncbi:hypothetical protein CK203_019895 [Vitis vinifera]|uniref:Uncharacterized protein n=1 Tax=Vitis vinifera TaxID=29760 RepID=A0A438J330_VITVI|nr:hypothetical protein CK203_019895 [Vitis vinifera]